MICPAGHRVIDSTGEHYTLREVAPGCYEYCYGDCWELQAAGLVSNAAEQPQRPAAGSLERDRGNIPPRWGNGRRSNG